jgi:uncharacterized YccA/Bax inhibitor family protein
MSIMRSSNPVFSSIEKASYYDDSTSVATYGGIVSKTAILLVSAVITGYLFIYLIASGTIGVEMLLPLIFVAFIVALISVIVASRSIRLAAPFALVYALAEGLILGLITVLFNDVYPGIALAAVVGTVSIFGVMLFLYSSRTIRVTPRFRRIMYTILFGILAFVVINLILSLFGVNLLYTEGNFSLLALGISGFFIIYGALLLTLDFDRAEMIVTGGMDKRTEWMVALGLMVTLVWIYIELLRFLAILASRRN